MNIIDNCFQIYSFVNLNNDISEANENFHIKEILKIQHALFSSISSILLFMKDQKPLLEKEIFNLQTTMFKEFESKSKSNITTLTQYYQNILNKIQDWVSLANRIDITERYILVGNIMDMDNIKNLFPLSLTIRKKRPLNTKKYSSLEQYQNFKDQSWNICSLYGIEYLFTILEKGYENYKKISKKTKFNIDIKKILVSYFQLFFILFFYY